MKTPDQSANRTIDDSSTGKIETGAVVDQVTITNKINTLFRENNYHIQPSNEPVENVLPGKIPGFRDLIKDYGVFALAKEDLAKVGEKTSEASVVTLKLFGHFEKLKPFALELMQKYNAVLVTPAINTGTIDGVDVGMVTLKVTG